MRDETDVQQKGTPAIYWQGTDAWLIDYWDQLGVDVVDAVLHRLLVRNNLLPRSNVAGEQEWVPR